MSNGIMETCIGEVFFMKLRREDISVKGEERTEINNFSDKIPNDILCNFVLFISFQEGEPKCSFADTGCLSRIPDPTFFLPFPDPGSRIRNFSNPDPRQCQKA
jgi:hypothetical protein